ncbi:hypothetical protein ABTK38_20425, partial [Acinetobacter baumannii]
MLCKGLRPLLRAAKPRADVDCAQVAFRIFQCKCRETLTAHAIQPLPACRNVLQRKRAGLPRIFRIECLGRQAQFDG